MKDAFYNILTNLISNYWNLATCSPTKRQHMKKLASYLLIPALFNALLASSGKNAIVVKRLAEPVRMPLFVCWKPVLEKVSNWLLLPIRHLILLPATTELFLCIDCATVNTKSYAF